MSWQLAYKTCRVSSFPPLAFVFDIQDAKKRLDCFEEFQHFDVHFNANELRF
jgi:hypothetical protein